EPAVLHGLRGFGVEARGEIGTAGVVGIERYKHALPGEQRGVVGDGVVSFDFVAPPVAEGGDAGAVGLDLRGDFIAFESVLQRGDFETELLGHAQQHQNLVGAVAMGVDQALALENLDQRLELEIATRREDALAAGVARLIILPRGLILAGLDEGLANDVLDAHARAGIAQILGAAARWILAALAGALGVLTERELDAGFGFLHYQAVGVAAPAHFDHDVEAADGVGRAVQQVGGGGAAGQIAVDGRILGIDDIAHGDHGRDGDGAFIRGFEGDVGVAVDQAGSDVLAAEVDDPGAHGREDLFSDLTDEPVADDD